MTNNSNENIDDILEVFKKIEGPLTDAERDIPADENEVILDGFRQNSEELKNNYVPIGKKKMPSLGKPVGMPRKKLEVGKAEKTDITLGMGRMRVSQPDGHDEVDDAAEEGEYGRSSASSDSDDDGSEYKPEPPDRRSQRTQSKSKSRRDPSSSSRSASPVQKISKRLRKAEKKKMSQDELNRRRREANKRNSKNYNKKKKEKEASLMGRVSVLRDHTERARKQNKELDDKLMAAYGHMGVTIECQFEGYISKDDYLSRKAEIDEYTRKKCRKDAELREKAKKLLKERARYDKANNDGATKKVKIQTYGSRKSRALHDLNIAKHEHELARLGHEVDRLAKWENLMMEVKGKFTSFFLVSNANAAVYIDLAPEEKKRFDELVDYFKVASSRRSAN